MHQNGKRLTRRVVLRRAGALGLLAAVQPGSGQKTNLATRRVWLRRLLEQVQAHLQSGQPISQQQRHLAGLTRIRFLYIDDRRGDLVLEGPAEDRWRAAEDEMVVGATSGRPLLELDDFIVAWRNEVGRLQAPTVSLDPRRESLRRVQQVIQAAGHPRTEAARRKLQQQLEAVWGQQDAVSHGVPLDSHFNYVMLQADWLMKRISLGYTAPGVAGVACYVDLEFDDLKRQVRRRPRRARRPPSGSRFWFYPAYSQFECSPELDAVQIPDRAVKLLTESHYRTVSQVRSPLPEPTAAAKQFADRFSQHFAALVDRQPMFAALRNLFDWVAVARTMQLIGVSRRIGYDFAFARSTYPVRFVATPRAMPGMIALRHERIETPLGVADLVFPAWGGVAMDVSRCVNRRSFRRRPALRARRQTAVAAGPTGPNGWWATAD